LKNKYRAIPDGWDAFIASADAAQRGANTPASSSDGKNDRQQRLALAKQKKQEELKNKVAKANARKEANEKAKQAVEEEKARVAGAAAAEAKVKEAEDEAARLAAEAATERGNVLLRYNHYKHEFPIVSPPGKKEPKKCGYRRP
jgi:hypothetical protein